MPLPPRLSRALSDEQGFMLIELTVSMVILTIALLAIMAGYDSAFTSLHRAGHQAAATKLANRQLELYSALPFASIGLDQATTQSVGNAAGGGYDALYATNDLLAGDWTTDDNGNPVQQPSGTVNDVTIAGCGAAPNCLPIQTVTGPDGHRYRIETFVRDRPNATGISWTERDVTIVVRDAQASTLPELVRLSSAFDRGPI
jgi:type II secretory pathway pseudopilin PulG